MLKGSNPLLAAPLDRRCALGLGRQLEARVRELPGGTPLPPSRGLAAELGVARGVVVRAYEQLRHEGVLEARVGAGTRVAPDRGEPTVPRRHPPARRWRLDLDPELSDLSLFPRSAWLTAYAAAVHDLPDRALGYDAAGGTRELQAQLAAYLARTRGVRCAPERVIVCAGLLTGFALVREALAATGTRRLHLPRVSHTALAQDVGRTRPWVAWLDVDDRGAAVAALPRAARQSVLVDPGGSHPLGVALAPERREALLAWADRHGSVIVESDAAAELQYAGVGALALQRELPEQIALIGSVSRALAPGLHIGWIVAPPSLVPALLAARRRARPGQPVLEQLALAHLIAGGELDRHLRGLRATYRRRAAALAAALAERLPDAHVRTPAGGLHLLLHLPPGVREDATVAAAAAEGVRVPGLAAHVLHGPPVPAGLVIGFGGLPAAAIPHAADVIARAVRAASP